MEPRVVAQVDRGVAQRAGQRLAMVIGGGAAVVEVLCPLQVVHAQAVNQQQDLAVDGRRGQSLQVLGGQHAPLVAKTQGCSQRVAGGLQLVAHHAVERGQHGLTLD